MRPAECEFERGVVLVRNAIDSRGGTFSTDVNEPIRSLLHRYRDALFGVHPGVEWTSLSTARADFKQRSKVATTLSFSFAACREWMASGHACDPREIAEQPWIVAMTANVSAEEEALYRASGMNDFLRKPSDIPPL